jgi:hypothetical protein
MFADIPTVPSDVSREARPARDRIDDFWIQLVRGEYLEIPGLSLTRTQLQRLWGLDDVLCDAILDSLIESHFLERTRNGGFVRVEARVR